MNKALQDIIKQKVDNLDTIDNRIYDRLLPSEKLMVNYIVEKLKSLEQKDGVILATEDNFTNLSAIIKQAKKIFFGTKYIETITYYSNQFDLENALTVKYFSTMVSDFDVTDNYKLIAKTAKVNALEYFQAEEVNSFYIKPLQRLLSQSVQSEVTYSQAVKSVREYVNGQADTRKGALDVYVKRAVRDGYAIADRTYIETVSNDLDINWYYYSSGTVAETREFCKIKEGNYYDEKTVRSWASQKWQGKYKGTNENTIKIYLGGYNCMHLLMPVSDDIVPDDVKNKGKEAEVQTVEGTINQVYDVKKDPNGLIKESLDAINKVHKVDGLNKIPIDYEGRLKVSGGYFLRGKLKDGTAIGKVIKLSPKMEMLGNAITHEIGHNIDLVAINNAKIGNPILQELKDKLNIAFNKSENYKETKSNPFITKETKNYLNSSDEMFARFYAKYIATESKSKMLNNDIDVFKSIHIDYKLNVAYDFSDADYNMLKPLLENIFREMKWIK